MAADAARSCTKLVQTLRSSSASLEQKRAAAAELLALPMTPQTWILAVGAIPALVEMTTQPIGEAELALVRVLKRISTYQHEHMGAVRTASGGVIASLVPLITHS